MKTNELKPMPMPEEWAYSNYTWEGQPHCICCNKPTKEGCPYLWLAVPQVSDDVFILPPDQPRKEPWESEFDERGWFPIGPGCLKKYPDLKLYARRF
jgi:hypothetical protein